MANLVYVNNVSVDGYIEDEAGSFDWGAPSDELHAYLNDILRPFGTHLYGRRLYETMAVWETDPSFATESEVMADFAQVWQSAAKVVFSTTLDEVPTSNTRVERTFDPDLVRELKATATSDLLIGGADIAGQAFEAGLVDEYQVLIRPIVVGGGKPSVPLGVRFDLELLEERVVSGVVHLRYRVAE